MEHSSSSVRLKHRAHGRTRSPSVSSAGQPAALIGGLPKQMVRQPRARLSTDARKARQFGREIVDRRHRDEPQNGSLNGSGRPPVTLPMCVLRGRLCFLLRVGHGDDDEILEHLDIGRIHDARIELDLLDLAGAGHLGGHHAAAGRAGDA